MDQEERYTIVWETDEDTGDEFLAYGDDGKEAKDADIEQLADLCDRDAENSNYHDFVGAHQSLGEILVEHLSKKAATKIMRDIAEGGLHGMNGLE